MYYFMFEGVPSPLNPELARVGGAFIICWIDLSTLSQAEEAARQYIDEAGWKIKSIEESRIVDRHDYDDNPTGLEYFEQAVVDGGVFVVHQYPAGE
jgi:hypothetical protein